ncbi:HmuY family protein [Flavobacterium rhizosphaerae]|uniref:HmuY family protein n=1 Tax=Flavobacterium rhizosphaerae TaxID=3163298 RepID=A0ABW8YRZ6_9FLAO
MKKIFLLTTALLTLVSCSDDDGNVAPIEQISEGAVFGTAENPLNVGGPNQPNQVYVDLSDESTVEVPRNSWDFGFYAGNDFRVILNSSMMMAAKQLETTDISLPQEADNTVSVGPYIENNFNYVDSPDGSLNETVFGDIATSEATAKVYLVNMGYKVPVTEPAAGAVNTTGDHRGWMKVKVWKDGNGYKIQYAALDAATHAEASIAKDSGYNFTFFNTTTGSTVAVEPQKDKWDIAFTTFTNLVNDAGEDYAYFYSDFVIINSRAGVSALKINGNAGVYEAFSLEYFNSGNFIFSNNQSVIGSEWRDVFTHTVDENIFFLVKDGSGNVYKLKFISMLGTDGKRGYPVFQYALLQ